MFLPGRPVVGNREREENAASQPASSSSSLHNLFFPFVQLLYVFTGYIEGKGEEAGCLADSLLAKEEKEN